MLSIRSALFAGAALLVPLSMAQAATVTYDYQSPYQRTEIHTGPVAISGFDSALGALTGVEIEYSFLIDSTASVEVRSQGSTNVRFQGTYDGTFLFSGPPSIAGAYETNFDTGLLSFSDVPFGEQFEVGTWNIVTSGILNPLEIDEFIDNDFTYQFDSFVTSYFAGGSFWSSISTFGQSSVRVTYSYDLYPDGGTPAVPEPLSWALMVAGFGLAGASIRKRKSGHARITA